MALRYRIYQNNGDGGPVDRTTPVGDVSGLTWDSGQLQAGADVSFAVAPYDDVTGFEDRTADSRVRVLLDDSGDDATGLPVAPLFLAARPASAGSAVVTWYYPRGLDVSGFHVFAWLASGPPNFTTPAGAVGARPPGVGGTSHARAFRFVLTGLSDATLYRVAVRGYNRSGEGRNSGSALVTGAASGPSAVESLTATAVP